VDAAIEAGARTPRAVHHACGTKPQCGRCLPEIADRLRAARACEGAHTASCISLTGAREPDELAALA
jgi:bacterioferritin-associated ferredoxin